jgi:FkbM family methyltransferase
MNVSVRKIAKEALPPLVARFVRKILAPKGQSNRGAIEAELKRLREMPRSKLATTMIFGWPFEIVDGQSFSDLYDTYFERQIYDFDADNDAPFIIDCGANVGITVTWFKIKYPNSRVVAFEADPAIFESLQKNCGHLKGVTLINAAVWDKEGEVPFAVKGGEGGHLAEFSSKHTPLVRMVPCVRLRSLLCEKCDFLKLDIEGAEIAVVRDCVDVLRNVDRAFIEYHSFIDRPQRLGQTISSLELAGFRLHIHTEMPSPRPLRELAVLNEKDLRLDLYCFRETAQCLSHTDALGP